MELTKGKWTITEDEDVIEIYEPTKGEIAKIHKRWMNGQNNQANAHLIAAAPDMYEALKAWDELRAMQPLDSGADIVAILHKCGGITDKALLKAETGA